MCNHFNDTTCSLCRSLIGSTAYHHFDSPALATLGMCKSFNCLIKVVRVSDQWLCIYCSSGHHLQSRWVTVNGRRPSHEANIREPLILNIRARQRQCKCLLLTVILSEVKICTLGTQVKVSLCGLLQAFCKIKIKFLVTIKNVKLFLPSWK